LGVRTGLQFPEDEIALAAGDAVALYTDGLTEARSPANELFGMERLETAFERCRERSLDETLEAVWEDIAEFRDGVLPGDDATLLLARLA
jgi:sigma-B regulation protein RsbU (phosphoserine phosphatase)